MRRICLGLAVVLGCLLVQRPAVAELYDDFEGVGPLDDERWTVTTTSDFTVEQIKSGYPLNGEAAFWVTTGYSASFGQAMTPDTYDPDEGVTWSVELRNLGGDTPQILPFIFDSPAGTLYVYVRYGDSAFVVIDAGGVSKVLFNEELGASFTPSSSNNYTQCLTVGLDETFITATVSGTVDGVTDTDYTVQVKHYLAPVDRAGTLGMEVYGGEAGALKDVRFDNVIIQPIPEPPPFLDVYLDVKPGSWPNPVNLKSKGVLPVAICGTEAFDVESIDPTSVRLTRDGMPDRTVIPIRWSIEDVGTPFVGESGTEHPAGPDGIPDLVLKFDTEQVVVSLLGGALPGDEIELLILGNLAPDVGGIVVKGADGIIIVGGKKN